MTQVFSYLGSGPIDCREQIIVSHPSWLCKEKVLLWGNQNDEPCCYYCFCFFFSFFKFHFSREKTLISHFSSLNYSSKMFRWYFLLCWSLAVPETLCPGVAIRAISSPLRDPACSCPQLPSLGGVEGEPALPGVR